ncbi:MAG: hypothetical protein KOO62_08220 [candidate division Zixibacteria bacterium]|nr:hypothetical protein [candidate division Zixibacteria bacterium]
MKIRTLIFLGLLLITSGCKQKQDLPAVPMVVDSLKATFSELKQAAMEHNEERFFALLDPTEAADLQILARQHGYVSISSYIRQHYHNWPDLDTLNYRELKASGDYIRLSLSGPGTNLGRQQSQVRHTFLLFRNHPGGWTLAGMSNLETPDRDRYGNEITVHETDLPPNLRFPRCF